MVSYFYSELYLLLELCCHIVFNAARAQEVSASG